MKTEKAIIKVVTEITGFYKACFWKLGNGFLEERLFKLSHKGTVGISQVKSEQKNVKRSKEIAFSSLGEVKGALLKLVLL